MKIQHEIYTEWKLTEEDVFISLEFFYNTYAKDQRDGINIDYSFFSKITKSKWDCIFVGNELTRLFVGYMEVDSEGKTTNNYILVHGGGDSSQASDNYITSGDYTFTEQEKENVLNEYNSFLKTVIANGGKQEQIYNIGHSMGASSAQYISEKTGIKTFGLAPLHLATTEQDFKKFLSINNLASNRDYIPFINPNIGDTSIFNAVCEGRGHIISDFLDPNIIALLSTIDEIPLKYIIPTLLNSILHDRISEFLILAERTASPLVLDLDFNGFTSSSQIFFDHDNNTFAELSNWINFGDALLFRDLNANGQLDSGAELFGNQTHLGDGTLAANGFMALADLDTNKDKVFDALDPAFASLQLFKDSNGNGRVDHGEFLTLADHVQSINLSYTNSDFVDTEGNEHCQTGTFIAADGTTKTIVDIWFKTDPMQTIDRNTAPVSPTITALPQIFLAGNIPSLHQAMQRNPVLQIMIENFALLNDPGNQRAACLDIIYEWVGATDILPNSRGSNIDARQLHVVEQFMGQFFKLDDDSRPLPGAGGFLKEAFDLINGMVYGQLTFAYQYKNIMTTLLSVDEQSLTGDPVWNVMEAATILKEQASTHANPEMYLRDFVRTLRESVLLVTDSVQTALFNYAQVSDNTLLPFFSIQNFITGTNKMDSLNGTKNNDWIEGLDGRDSIKGNGGNDTFDGGTGNDFFYAQNGKQTFLFGLGDGKDTINMHGKKEQCSGWIQMKAGITPDMILINNSNYFIFSFINNKNDTITVGSTIWTKLFSEQNLSGIRFDNGQVWDIEDIKTRLFAGSEFNDEIRGSIEGDTIRGQAGKDTIYAHLGNDIIYGGIDNDILDGEKGDDIIHGEDGNDMIYGRDGNDVLIGNNGDDRFNGGDGTDSMDGGKGNDFFSFDSGNDTIIYRPGDGQDYIFSKSAITDSFNVLQFKEGIVPLDIHGTQSGEGSFQILFKISPGDKITINSFMKNGGWEHNESPISHFEFMDGTIWTPRDLLLQHLKGTEKNETMYGMNEADTIFGGAGIDKIYGQGGADIIYGGEGNDLLNGESGSDTLYGEAGDDKLYGGRENDILVGGLGNDTLYGEQGSNIYKYELGDGQDTIELPILEKGIERKNILQLGLKIEKDFITLTKKGVDLKIFIKGSTDDTGWIEIDNFFNNINVEESRLFLHEIQLIETSEVWNIETILEKVTV